MTTMTCDQCRQAIAVADLTDWGDVERVASHCRTCAACAALATDVRDSARRVADLLDAIPPGVPAVVVAERATIEASLVRQRHQGWQGVARPLAIAAAVIAVILSTAFAVRFTRHAGREEAPAHELRTIALRCLTIQQTETLLAPLTSRDVSIEFSPLGGNFVRVSGPPATVAEAGRVIAKFDDARSLTPGASCIFPDRAGGDR